MIKSDVYDPPVTTSSLVVNVLANHLNPNFVMIP